MLSAYIEELKKIKLLSRQEEATLWELKSKGNIDAHHKLITSYQPLVFKIAMAFHVNENKVLELIQEGTVGLLEAASKYDYKKGVAFSLYASHRIKGRMVDYLNKESDEKNISLDIEARDETGVLLVDTIPSNLLGPQELAEKDFFKHKLKIALERLSTKEKQVLQGLYMEDRTVKELAEDIEVTTSHIYRLQKKGVRRLRGMMSKLMADLKK